MTALRIAITGAAGQLGRQLVAVFGRAGWDVLRAERDRLDILDPSALASLGRWRPRVVVNAAAWTDVDGCARDPDRALRVNGEAAGAVAAAAAEVGALAVQVSTNEVFDGTAERAYVEDDVPSPINPYGVSKRAGELAVVKAAPEHLIVRTAWIFGPGGRNFPSRIVEVARARVNAGEPLRVVLDEIGNPTWAPDLAESIRMAIDAVLDGRLESGILHLAGEPATSRYEWARLILARLPDLRLEPIPAAAYPRPSRVPPRAVLSTERARVLGIPPSDWQRATVRYAAELLDAVPA